jgi:hypothetical protein
MQSAVGSMSSTGQSPTNTPGFRLFMLLWKAKADAGIYTWDGLPKWRQQDYEHAAEELLNGSR